MKNIDETRNYFIQQINQNELMSMKQTKKNCRVWRLTEHLLFLFSTVTRCVSIFAFASLAGIPIEIMSSAVGLTTCAIIAV